MKRPSPAVVRALIANESKPRWEPTQTDIDFARWKWRRQNEVVLPWRVCPHDGCRVKAQAEGFPLCSDHDLRMIEVTP